MGRNVNEHRNAFGGRIDDGRADRGTGRAFAQSDCTKTVPPSPFGKDDQTGATNRVTAAVTKAAAAEIQTGKVTTMTNPLVDGVPLFGTRFTHTILTSTTMAPGAALGENNLTYMEDTWLSQSHVETHIAAPLSATRSILPSAMNTPPVARPPASAATKATAPP